MPVTVEFPDDLPCVSRIDGYGMNMAAALIRTPFEAGNTRQRRMHAVLPHEITVAWRCSNAQLHPLINWLNAFGYDWFKLRLAGIEASEASMQSSIIDVRLMTDLQVTLMQFHRENWWTVRASAEYQPPVATLAPTAIEEFSMMFVPLHRSVPDPLYGELVYVNLDEVISMSRNVQDTDTRVRGGVVDPRTTTEPVLRIQRMPRRRVIPRASDVPTVNEEWNLDAQITAGPGGGRMRLNNASQALASMVWINYQTADAVDLKNIMVTLDAESEIYVQDKSDSSKWARYLVTAAPVDHGTYMEFAASFMAGGVQLIAQRVIVLVYQPGTAPAPEPEPNLIEVLVKETPQEIMALATSAQRIGTRILGAPRLSPSPVARH